MRAIDSKPVTTDDSIPTYADVLRMKSRRTKPRPRLAAALPQLSFDLLPPAPAAPAYRPIVLEPEPPPEPILYTVRQLIAAIRQVVEGAYRGIVNVEGEVSNCRPAASGHLYFTLKDGDAQLPIVMFRRQAALLGFKLRDGLAVEVRGRIAVYETRGQIQLIAETLRPRGTGALQLAFEQLRDKLRREGLFDRAKKPLPPYPHCIGIVTSAQGAAIHDIIQVVRRRHARLNLLIYPAAVQGPQSAQAVAAGVRWFNRHPERVDLILVTRGGGSLEDLAGFNDEALARTIAASALPVVAAIGHEIDHTIAEFVADLRAPTPSAAAELITAAQHRIGERVQALERRVYRAGELHLLRARRRLERLSAEQVLARLHDAISLRQQKVDELRFRLSAASDRCLRQRTQRLAQLEARLRRHAPHVRVALAQQRLAATQSALTRVSQQIVAARSTRLERAGVRLEALSPLAVLNRGYAIVFTEDGRVLRDAAEVAPDQQIRARLGKGSVRARITQVETNP